MIILCSVLFETVIPSKIFEFMAMNVPVIMGVKGEALDIVLKVNAGVAMRPDSKEALLECIRLIREKVKALLLKLLSE